MEAKSNSVQITFDDGSTDPFESGNRMGRTTIARAGGFHFDHLKTSRANPPAYDLRPVAGRNSRRLRN